MIYDLTPALSFAEPSSDWKIMRCMAIVAAAETAEVAAMGSAQYSVDFVIIYEQKVVDTDGILIEIDDYLAEHLECDEDELGDAIENTSDEKLISIAEWAASGCSYMNNIVVDAVLEVEIPLARKIAKRLSKNNNESQKSIQDRVFKGLSHEIISAEIIIGEKRYKGI